MRRRGLLLTMTRPPAGMEDEFNAWYDAEHLPERLSIRGFRSARRWVSGKTYLATYELDSAAVLASRTYLSFLNDPTPWTRRCLGSLVLFKRWACEQLEPGAAGTHPRARAVLLVASRAPVPLQVRHALRIRRFAASSGSPAHIGLIDLGRADRRGLRAIRAPIVKLFRAY
jgi:hypothetical protein